MNTDMGVIELVLLGVLLLVVLLWFGRGVGAIFQESREAPKDWPGVLLPLAAVIVFVAFLFAMAAG